MDRLERLRVLIEIAERRSFSAAARARRTSAAAVSRAVAALEQELGVALFRRTTRHVALTPEGAAFVEESRHAIAMLDDAARVARGGSAEPRGRLVVTAPVVFGRMHVLPIVTELLETHPELRIELMLTDRFVRLTDEGADVAVRIADLADSSMVRVQVGETRRILVASPTYIAARGVPKDMQALRQHELLAFDAFAPNSEWRLGRGSGLVVRFEPRLLTNSMEAAIDASIAGVGIALVLGYQVREHINAGRLVEIRINDSPPSVPISLLFQANRQSSPNVRAFVEACKSKLRGRFA